MDGVDPTLSRIAAALERIAPGEKACIDWLAHPAYVWTGGQARALDAFDALALDQLRGIDQQKAAFATNLARLAQGAAAHDMLLWGARGMGKSALVRAAVKAEQAEQSGALALVQLSVSDLASFPALIAELCAVERAFLLFIDDLGFSEGATQDSLALRSALDGGLTPRPAHIRLAVTTNRRAITRRDGDEGEALHERDERDNALALADRFGLTLGFHPCDNATFLEILRAYLDPIGLAFDEDEALAFAIARGNRSGRIAHQFATEIAGRAGKLL